MMAVVMMVVVVRRITSAAAHFFNVQRDLVKIRFHHSEKYQHIPVRIPKSEKNKGE